MDDGFLKIWRRLFNHELWTERRKKSKFEAWLDMIQMARYSHEPERRMIGNTVKIIQRGQIFISQSYLESRWRWSRQEIRGFMDYLKNHDMVTCKSDRHGSLITLVSYNDYNVLYRSNINQPNNQPNNQKTTNQNDCYSTHYSNEQPEDNQASNQRCNQITTTNIRKKERNTSLESSTDNKHCIADQPEEKKVCVYPEKLELFIHPPRTPVPNHAVDRYSDRYKECVAAAKRIMDHLNAVTGKNAPSSGFGFDLIINLLWRHITEKEIIAVIDKKNNHSDFKRLYMRPQTLFKPENFEKYQLEDIKDYQQDAPKVKNTVTPREDFLNDPHSDLIEFDGGYKERQPDGTMKTFYYEDGE